MKFESKIEVTFKGGMKRVLKSPGELCKIDRNRRALFVFKNLQVFGGYSDGEVDDDGDFAVFPTTMHGMALPFDFLLGWCYEKPIKKR